MSPSPEQITAVVLAGGFGTRVQHLLPELPKPMAPVAGKPFVEWVVRYLGRQGITRVILSTGYRAETIERHFQPQPVPGIAVRCVPETTPLGTAGGFLNAIKGETNSPAAWLVLNGDSLVFAPLNGMFESLAQPDWSGAILGLSMPDASRYGTIEADASGALARFNEKKPGAGVISAGAYLFRAAILRNFPARTPLSFETDVFPKLIADRTRLKVCVTTAPFLDIGTPETLAQAGRFIEQNLAALSLS